ncbi:vWA domain-containing protein [Melghirimyces algeriensis]|uniref:D-amino-acid dehydrogenase/Ca-activated chloride channel family protein n=1 Tax=Melghirimyces algeriensis TaxID=910412 RepID=A0A521E935_9BACL|nr:VWA domain-containing protein [Melghirimyces algeriensis]SMO80437.1 D-amino-acid dehydrogenase/Ca-activated chloride channel family protein [Melghirimyces algeriensis]
MKNRLYPCLTILFSTWLVISGCGTGETNGDKKTAEKKEEKIPEAAHDPKEIMKQKPGRFSGENYDQKKVEKALDQFPDNLSTQEAYDRLVYLLGENYRPKYEEVMNFDTAIRVNEKTPDQKVDVPSIERMNVEIVLDASGSMAGKVDGGVKMDLAKQAIKKFVSELPEEANVSLRVYGHKGSNEKKEKKVSCQSNELVYPLKSYNSNEFTESLDQFEPTGWTPLASAIQAANDDLKEWEGKDTRNIVYVVSDGVETCGGDPVKEAKKLGASGIEPMVKIIGFDVDNAGQKQLKQVAKASNGSYQTIQSGDDLKEYLEAEKEKLKEKWEGWSTHSYLTAQKKWGGKFRKLESLLYKKPDGKERGLAYIVNQEVDRLKKAAKYLKKKEKLKEKVDESYETHPLLEKIINRERSIDKFILNLRVSMMDKLREEREKEQKRIREKEKEMTDQ